MEVIYEFNSVTILDCHGDILMVGPYDPEKRLLYVDLLELILISRSWEKRLIASAYRTSLKEHEEFFVYHAALPRATPEIIRLYRRIHHQIEHMSPGKLMDAIKLDAIDGVPAELSPAMIQQITRIEQCPSCAIFRRRHENIKKGSGIYPAAAGAYFTVDEWGPYPPDSMGKIYSHTAMCSATGFLLLAKNKAEDFYQMEYDLLQLNNALGHKFVSIRVDAATAGNSKKFSAIAADFGGYVNSCDKERQSRNPVETSVRPITTIAAIQLSEAAHVSEKEWGSSLLHSFDINNAFPNKRSKAFGDGTMSPLEAFTGWKPDMSKWHKFGTVGTAERMGYVRKFDEPHKIAVGLVQQRNQELGITVYLKGEKV